MMAGLLSAQLAQQAELVERAIARDRAGPQVKIDRAVMRDLHTKLKLFAASAQELENVLDAWALRVPTPPRAKSSRRLHARKVIP